MQQKPANELIYIEFHLPELACAVIFPRKMYFPVFHFHNPTVGNGNAEHVTREVFQYLLRVFSLKLRKTVSCSNLFLNLS
jgi:hypothetical protein